MKTTTEERVGEKRSHKITQQNLPFNNTYRAWFTRRVEGVSERIDGQPRNAHREKQATAFRWEKQKTKQKSKSAADESKHNIHMHIQYVHVCTYILYTYV